MKVLANRSFGVIWRGLVLGVLILCLTAISWIVFEALTEVNLPLPSTFGNFDRVVKMLGEAPSSARFSFAVVGDTRGNGTFETIMEHLWEEPLAFLVLLGDCTQRPLPADHNYFRMKIVTELATSYPTFYVAGDHDIRPGCFTQEQFEQFYGPTQFYFRYGGSLFIFLRVLPRKYCGVIVKSDLQDNDLFFKLVKEKIIKSNSRNSDYAFFDDDIADENQLRERLRRAGITDMEPILAVWRRSDNSMEETLTFLERVLQAERQEAKRVFVFQHVPPPVTREFSFDDIKQPQKLIEIFDRFKVNYVIAGDYHGYVRLSKVDTNYIVSAGGGAELRKNKYGAFFHALVITVNQDEVTEKILLVPHKTNIENVLEYLIIARLWPWVEQRRFLAGLVLAVMLFSTGGMVWELRRYWKAEQVT